MPSNAPAGPIITRAGAVFSTAVVVSSLATGAAFALGASTWVPFAVVLLLSALAGAAIHRALPASVSGPEPAALFPTLLSIVSRNVVESSRGRCDAIVTVVSYLGFLLGPVYVGLWASATGLRGAMIAVAALGLTLAALTLPLLALSRYAVTPRPAANHAGETGVPSAHSS